MLKRFLRAGGWLVLLPVFVIAAALNSAQQSRAAAADLAARGIDAGATITEKHAERRYIVGRGSKVAEPVYVIGFSYSSGSVMKGDFHVGLGTAHVSEAYYAATQVGDSKPVRCLPKGEDLCELEPGSLHAEATNAVGVAAVIAVITVPLFAMIAWRAARKGNAAQG